MYFPFCRAWHSYHDGTLVYLRACPSGIVRTIKAIIMNELLNLAKLCSLTHSHTMTPFDAPGKQAF